MNDKRISRRALRYVSAGVVILAALAAVPLYLAYADPGELRTPVNYYAPCAFSNRDGAGSGTWEVIVGNFRGNVSTSAEAYADAFFDGDTGDCGYGDHAAGVTGTGITANHSFVIRAESAIAVDTHASLGGTVTFAMAVTRWSATNCTGSQVEDLGSVSKTYSFGTSPTYDWAETDPWDSTFSFSTAVDGTPSTIRYYKYTMSTTTTVTGGSPVVSPAQTGCFDVKSEP